MSADIIHILSSLRFGGAERFVLDLAKQQINDGYNVTVLNLGSPEDPLIHEANELNIPLITIQTDRILNPFKFFKHKFHKARTIHVHNAVCLFRIFIYVIFVSGTIVYTRHSEQTMNLALKVAHLLTKFKIKELTFVSEGSRARFNEQFHWPNIPSKVIDNGVFIPEDKLYNRNSSDSIKIISIGRMVPLKRHTDLLDAVSQLDNNLQEKIELHFFGDGELRDKIEGIARTKNFKSVFHGMVRDRNQIYKQADITVCMSETEGLSIALLESMAWSIPIIATNVGGNPHCVENNLNGFLYECADIEKLKELLSILIIDDEKRIRMGEASRSRAITMFSINETANIFYKSYWGESRTLN